MAPNRKEFRDHIGIWFRMLEFSQLKYPSKRWFVSNFAGKLFIVATPIGHRQDISERALEVLRAVDRIAAEDTRHTRSLLQSYGIDKPLVSCHEHNESERVNELISRLQSGESLALVSDAGTPLISDPGYRLVRAAQAAEVSVVPVPGPCSPIVALSVSGLPTDRFVFEGFLPARASARRARLQKLANESRTLVMLESCHRIVETLADCVGAFGAEREAVVARELTKMFETVRRAPLGELTEWVQADSYQQKGEIVLLIAGRAETNATETLDPAVERTLAVLLESLSLKQSVELTVRLTGSKRGEVYAAALQLQKNFQIKD